MRTTLTIDDELAEALREAAFRDGTSFKEVVNETLRRGLAAKRQPAAKRYQVKAVSLGGVLPGVNLDKALRLADALEDEEIARKLAMRK